MANRAEMGLFLRATGMRRWKLSVKAIPFQGAKSLGSAGVGQGG